MTHVIFLPGVLNDEALWHHQMEALARDATCKAIPLTMADNLQDVARAVLAQSPPRFALAGMSMGGYTALEIWRQAPERVERLAFVNTSARGDTPEGRARREQLLRQTEIGGRFQGVTPRLLPTLVHPSHVDNPMVGGIIIEMAQRVGREAFIRQQKAVIGRPDSLATLPTINVPTIVVGGRQDQMTPVENSEEMAKLIPGARLTVFEECGHVSPLERPAELSAIMKNWLRL